MAQRTRNDKWHLIGLITAGVAFILVVVAVTLNFTTIKDFVVGMRYKPTPEMEKIRESLDLTGEGLIVFNASLPELMERNEFNQNCREVENETAILGCYRDDKIYIYNITDEELSGVKKLTAAHELLHGIYKRMGDGDRRKWAEILTKVYNDNKSVLAEEIELYPEEQKQEELYVRAGTEIKNLPDELEEHYAGIFKNQDKVVDFYESYIAVFREIEKKLKDLLNKTSELSVEISNKTKEYEERASTLNTRISEFNECAKTLDCFSSAYEFNQRRNELTTEQSALEQLYNEINSTVSQYNAYVAEYNENVLHGQVLNQAINSSEKVEVVKD